MIFFYRNPYISIQENVICEMAAILSRPQYVKSMHVNHMSPHSAIPSSRCPWFPFINNVSPMATHKDYKLLFEDKDNNRSPSSLTSRGMNVWLKVAEFIPPMAVAFCTRSLSNHIWRPCLAASGWTSFYDKLFIHDIISHKTSLVPSLWTF